MTYKAHSIHMTDETQITNQRLTSLTDGTNMVAVSKKQNGEFTLIYELIWIAASSCGIRIAGLRNRADR